MKCYEIIEKLEDLSPKMYAENWDNVGLLVGRRDKEIHSVMIALDASDRVIRECMECGADMLITHHPMIFSPMKKIVSDDFIGRRVIKLIERGICYYAMHTNFDVMGMGDAAADEISLKKRSVLEPTYEDDISQEGFGRIGKLPHIMTLAECAEIIKESFHVPSVKIFGDLDAELETAAIMPGSGKSGISPALQKGADVLITGDIDHHDGIDAVARGLNIIDAGHYGIEKLFIPYMEQYLRREVKELTIYTEKIKEPFTVV